MENKPVSQKLGWFRRLALWKKISVIFGVLFLALFVSQLVPVGKQKATLSQVELDVKEAFFNEGNAPAMSPTQAERMGMKLPADYEQRVSQRKIEMSSSSGMVSDEPGVSMIQPTATNVLTSLDTWGRQLILNASMAMEVSDVKAAYDRVQFVAAGEGAIVTSANLEPGAIPAGGKEVPYGHATLVIRMPQSRFQAVRQKLLGIAGDLKGKVMRDQVSSEDVTEQYVDLQSRLRHWKSQESQLLGIMAKAVKISDILAVRNELSSVQQEIERLTGQLRFLQNRVDLSTITVEIFHKYKPTPPPKPTIASALKNVGKQVSVAFIKSLQDVVQLAGYLAIGIVYLAPFAIIAIVAWLSVRTTRRKALPRPPAS